MAEPSHVIDAHESYGLPLAFDANGSSLVTGGFDGSIALWDTSDWSEIRRRAAHGQSVNCGGRSGAGELVTGSTDATARVWTLPDVSEGPVFEGHKKTVAGLATNPADRRVATASYDETVRVWATDATEESQTLAGHTGNVTCVTFAGEGDIVAAGGLGDELVVWSLPEGAELTRIAGHGEAVVGVAVGADGRIFSAGYNGTLHVWTGGDGATATTADLPIPTRPTGLAAHPADPYIAVAREGGVAVLTSEGDLVEDHEAPIKGVSTPLFSPDGRLLAAGGADGAVRLYEG